MFICWLYFFQPYGFSLGMYSGTTQDFPSCVIFLIWHICTYTYSIAYSYFFTSRQVCYDNKSDNCIKYPCRTWFLGGARNAVDQGLSTDEPWFRCKPSKVFQCSERSTWKILYQMNILCNSIHIFFHGLSNHIHLCSVYVFILAVWNSE